MYVYVVWRAGRAVRRVQGCLGRLRAGLCACAAREDGRRSIFYGKLAADLPPTAAVPHDWDEGDYLESLRLEREKRRRLERAARAGNPPPRRSDARYGPQAGNPRGDDAFRDDRRAWYEQVMEQSLESTRGHRTF